MEKLLGIKELANCLGISVHTAYCWVHQKKIPYVKLGRRVLFDPVQVKRWIDEKVVKPDIWENFLVGVLLGQSKKGV